MSFVNNHLLGTQINPVSATTLRWWEADFGVLTNGSGNVTQVWDQSGHGGHLPQSTGPAQTTLVLNAINGKPALAMTNSRHIMNLGTGNAGNNYIIFVAKFNATASASYLFDGNGSGARVAAYVTPTDFVGFAGSVQNVGTVDTNFNLHTYRFRGGAAGTGKYGKNGAVWTDYIFGQNLLTDFNLGQRITGVNPFVGQLAAFVIETDQTRAFETTAYFKEKYGF